MNSPNATPFLVLGVLALSLTVRDVCSQAIYEPYTFTTIAGKAGVSGSKDGTGSNAQFDFPNNVALDGTGKVIYVLDTYNDTVRQMVLVGNDWVVTTIAGKPGSPGSIDGTNSAARFNFPHNLALDRLGNIYFANNSPADSVRKLTHVGTNWLSSTIAGLPGHPGSADGTNSIARFNGISGVAVDEAGTAYISAFNDHTIRQITPFGSDCVVTTIAGLVGHSGSTDGVGNAARFNQPSSLALDESGNLYVTEAGNKTVRQLTRSGTNWVVTTVAGLPGHAGTADGIGTAVRFTDPEDIAVDRAGNLYVSDQSSANTIRKLRRVGTNWISSTIGGRAGNPGNTDGIGRSALFSLPMAEVDAAGNVYVADIGNHTIRRGVPALALISAGPAFGFASSQFGFDVAGPAGQPVVVEASTDLLNWAPPWTNTLAGPLSFSDPQSASDSRHFYRARTK